MVKYKTTNSALQLRVSFFSFLEYVGQIAYEVRIEILIYVRRPISLPAWIKQKMWTLLIASFKTYLFFEVTIINWKLWVPFLFI